jgi:SOS-response transcriptional repressor LexA
MTIVTIPTKPDRTAFDDVLCRQPVETPDVLDWIQAYVKQTGFAPSLDMIRGAANFRRPGGVGRLLMALERYGLELERAKPKEAR